MVPQRPQLIFRIGFSRSFVERLRDQGCRSVVSSRLRSRRLEAHYDRDNYASLRVVERTGFECSGLVKDEDADGVERERTRWVLVLPAETGEETPESTLIRSKKSYRLVRTELANAMWTKTVGGSQKRFHFEKEL